MGRGCWTFARGRMGRNERQSLEKSFCHSFMQAKTQNHQRRRTVVTGRVLKHRARGSILSAASDPRRPSSAVCALPDPPWRPRSPRCDDRPSFRPVAVGTARESLCQSRPPNAMSPQLPPSRLREIFKPKRSCTPIPPHHRAGDSDIDASPPHHRPPRLRSVLHLAQSIARLYLILREPAFAWRSTGSSSVGSCGRQELHAHAHVLQASSRNLYSSCWLSRCSRD